MSSSRRHFLKQSALSPLMFWQQAEPSDELGRQVLQSIHRQSEGYERTGLDLSPAKWIWFPSERTLPNTFILFRKSIEVKKGLVSAKGWILADSRYELRLNGQRLQWGPGPTDPRFSEADPVDLKEQLEEGENILGVTVLYFGLGDGTWVMGKPGLIMQVELEYEDSSTTQLLTDSSFQCRVATSWKPGQHKRWYLRALQEEFDARKYPYGWDQKDFRLENKWRKAMELENAAHLPSICSTYRDFLNESMGDPETCQIFPRSTALLKEEPIPANQLVKVQEISWNSSPEEYFNFVTPDAYAILYTEFRKDSKLEYECILDGENSFLLTYSFHEQMVGFPYLQIEAPEGTTIELMIQEAHDPEKDLVMNNHFHAWSRFICQVGMNELMTFEYESLRWIQLHIHGGRGRAKIKQVGVRRRTYPWPESLKIQTRNKGLRNSIAAGLNTLTNCAQETLVDGMGRERQQYSGDVGHQLHAIYGLSGQWKLAERFMITYGHGFTKNGFFMDTWPGHDRMNRISQRELDLTPWGPLLDHGVAFVFDNYYHYLYSGRKEGLQANFGNFLKFFLFLKELKGEADLLPVENLGIPTVWIDLYFKEARFRQCAFNLYVSALCIRILPYLCEVMGEESTGQQIKDWGEKLLSATQNSFWDEEKQLFIMNKPWMTKTSEAEIGDRALAMAVLFDLCPGKTDQCIQYLAEYDKLGHSFPANAGWRYWALPKGHRTDVVIQELQQKWANLPSVKLNNSIQEHWEVQPDSNAQWSHAGVIPLYISSMCLAGIMPLQPGSEEILIFPQPDSLQSLRLNFHTPKGILTYQHTGRKGRRKLSLDIPEGVTAHLKVQNRERLAYPESQEAQEFGYTTYLLAGGQKYDLSLKLI